MSNPILISDTVAVAANTTIENVIASNTAAQRYIRPPMNVQCKLMAAVSGLSIPGLRLELIVDGKSILDGSDARTIASAGQLLQPDDIIVEQFFCRQGAQIVLRAINGSAGSLSVTYRIEMVETTERMLPQRITQRAVVIPANTTVTVLSGLRFERPIVDSYLDVFASAGATGMQLEVYIDGNSIAPAFPVAATNRMPLNPYDQLLNNLEVPLDKLIELRAINTTGAGINLYFKTALQDLHE